MSRPPLYPHEAARRRTPAVQSSFFRPFVERCASGLCACSTGPNEPCDLPAGWNQSLDPAPPAQSVEACW